MERNFSLDLKNLCNRSHLLLLTKMFALARMFEGTHVNFESKFTQCLKWGDSA